MMHERRFRFPDSFGPPEPPAAEPPERIRHQSPRWLLAAAVALLVARPFATGEDPARDAPAASALPAVVLMTGWLGLAAATAVWRVFARSERPLLGGVELAMIALVGWFWLTALRSSCWFAARFVAWEWTAVAAVLFAVRQLAATNRDQDGLLNALLATAVGLVIQAGYEAAAKPLGLPGAGDIAVVAPPPWADGAPAPGSIRPDWWPALRGPFARGETLAGWLLLTGPLLVWAAAKSADGRWTVAGWIGTFTLGLAVVAFVSDRTDGSDRPIDQTLAAWRACTTVAERHPLFGIGPGQIARELPAALPPEAVAVDRPMSAYFGLATAAGLGALALVLAALIGLGWVTILAIAEPADDAQPPDQGWTFYFGGLAGLLIGLVLQVGSLPPTAPAAAIVPLGVAAAVRALGWFAAFAWLDGPIGSARGRAIASAVGLTLSALLAVVGDAPAWPALLHPAAAVTAVLLNQVSRGPSAWSAGRAGPLLWAVPVGIVAGLFLTTTAVPTARADQAMRAAWRAMPMAAAKRGDIDKYHGLDRESARRSAIAYYRKFVLEPLRRAELADPTDPRIRLEQAFAFLAIWELGDPEPADRAAIVRAEQAQRLDPRSADGFRAEFLVRLRFAELTEKTRSEQFAQAEQLMAAIVERNPAEAARLKLRLSAAYHAAGDEEQGRKWFVEAARTAEFAPGPRYRLRGGG